MGDGNPNVPPRPIGPGDVVTAFCFDLGEWTAGQITGLHADTRTAELLDLDWSGPRPASVDELGDVSPLRLTHHSWNGRLSHRNVEWVLPRSCRVVGAMPLLYDQPSNTYALGWGLGDQLARQRRWDGGAGQEQATPWKLECRGTEIDRVLGRTTADPKMRELWVGDVESLDCGRLVECFPNLTHLNLHGRLGRLSAADRLNELGSLQWVCISDLFGMSAPDRLLPHRVPHLETLLLDGIPAGYATAMRSTWRPEIPNGTYVDIRRGRKPDWVAENRDNPLRDWDGREHISVARYRKAVAQYRATRRAILAVLRDGTAGDPAARLEEIGREYGEAFNTLDRRSFFIETEERDELFAALHQVVTDAETAAGTGLGWARSSLVEGVEAVRDW